jgi:glycosyltransferase involved in cell wall biosynthesis
MLAKTPVVIAHVHGLGRSRNFKRKLMNFLLFRKINRIIPVAESVKKDVLKNNWFLSENKFFVLENSVDYERFANVSVSKAESKQMLGLPNDAFVYGTVGRLAPTKGLSYLIEAFLKVKEQIPAAHLVLVGEGRCRAELEKHAANTSYHSSIHFLGHRQNIEQLLRGIDVFVLASVAEGMPRAILEAMAAGVPCIATQVGGIPDIINSGDVGFLVPAADPVALAKAMVTVANMPKNELAELIKNAQNRVKQVYSHEVMRVRLTEIYEQMLARRRSSNGA